MESEGVYKQFMVLIRASRIPGWCFGPILYTIGVIHSRILPKSVPGILSAGFQIFCLSCKLGYGPLALSQLSFSVFQCMLCIDDAGLKVRQDLGCIAPAATERYSLPG